MYPFSSSSTSLAYKNNQTCTSGVLSDLKQYQGLLIKCVYMFQLNIQTGSHLQIAYKKDDILHSGKTKCMYHDNQENYIHAWNDLL